MPERAGNGRKDPPVVANSGVVPTPPVSAVASLPIVDFATTLDLLLINIERMERRLTIAQEEGDAAIVEMLQKKLGMSWEAFRKVKSG
jgi:hypothetical protein